MAALTTAYQIPTMRNRGLESYVAVSGDNVYSGALVGTGTATGTNAGYLKPWTGAASGTGKVALLGIAVITEYDTDEEDFVVVGNGTLEVPVNTEGVIIDKIDMTADAGTTTIADVGKPVFCLTDNPADIGKTYAGAGADPVGTLIKFRTGEICDVRIYNPVEAHAMRDVDVA